MKAYYAKREQFILTRIKGKHENVDAAQMAAFGEIALGVLQTEEGDERGYERFDYQTEVIYLGTNKNAAENVALDLERQLRDEKWLRERAAQNIGSWLVRYLNECLENFAEFKKNAFEKIEENGLQSWAGWNLMQGVALEAQAKIARDFLCGLKDLEGEQLEEMVLESFPRLLDHLDTKPPRMGSSNVLDFPMAYTAWNARQEMLERLRVQAQMSIDSVLKARAKLAARKG